MWPIIPASMVLLLSACAVRASDGRPSISNIGCTNVYVMHTPGIVSAPNIYWEVLVSVDNSPLKAQGKLGSLDWGAFQVCGEKFSLRFRTLIDTRSVEGPDIRSSGKYYVSLVRAGNVYFKIGTGYLDEISGKQMLDEVVKKLALLHVTPASWEWEDRRELYYGKSSKCALEKSERCP